MVLTALLLAIGLGRLFHWDIGMTAGMLAGAMTSTPVLVGAGDTLRQSVSEGRQLTLMQDHLSLGYALTYLIGLVSLILGARYLPAYSVRICQPVLNRLPVSADWTQTASGKCFYP